MPRPRRRDPSSCAARQGPDRWHTICVRQDRLEESEHVGRSARVVDHTSMLHHVIHSQPQAAEDGRSELVRGCLQHAFHVCGLGSLQVMTVCDLGCASSVVCAERFRTVAKSFTAGAHTPAVMRGLLARGRSRSRRPDWALCAPRRRWRDGEVAVCVLADWSAQRGSRPNTLSGGWDDRHMPVAHGRVALVTGRGGSGMRSTQERKRCGC